MITETTPTANDAAILAGPCTAGFVASGADRVAEHLIVARDVRPAREFACVAWALSLFVSGEVWYPLFVRWDMIHI